MIKITVLGNVIRDIFSLVQSVESAIRLNVKLANIVDSASLLATVFVCYARTSPLKHSTYLQGLPITKTIAFGLVLLDIIGLTIIVYHVMNQTVPSDNIRWLVLQALLKHVEIVQTNLLLRLTRHPVFQETRAVVSGIVMPVTFSLVHCVSCATPLFVLLASSEARANLTKTLSALIAAISPSTRSIPREVCHTTKIIAAGYAVRVISDQVGFAHHAINFFVQMANIRKVVIQVWDLSAKIVQTNRLEQLTPQEERLSTKTIVAGNVILDFINHKPPA